VPDENDDDRAPCLTLPFLSTQRKQVKCEALACDACEVRTTMITRFVTLVAASLVFFAAGCSDTGPKRFRVSGEVTFDKQPIASGDILFTPDGAKQNSGPQGIAKIRDGKFDTAAAEGQGIAGGPTVVRITGFTPAGGRIICETEIHVDLPRADSTQTFDVPTDKAFKGKKGPEI
jgi:hypothetical protein